MKDKQELGHHDESADKRVVVSLVMDRADVERLKQAFEDGRLRDLGITEIQFSTPLEAESTVKKWSEGKRGKRREKSGEDGPPLP